MLREEIYHKVAKEFQTAIGTALPIITSSKSNNCKCLLIRPNITMFCTLALPISFAILVASAPNDFKPLLILVSSTIDELYKYIGFDNESLTEKLKCF